MSQAAARASFGPVQWGIIALTLATALIHLVLAIPMTLVMFYLNGLGYIVLLVALYLPRLAPYRRRVRWALMAFAAVTLLGWAGVGERSSIAFLDKTIEVALLVLLWVEWRRGG